MRLVLRLRHGIWCCCMVDEHTRMPVLPWGHGYTSAAAYADWRAVTREST